MTLVQLLRDFCAKWGLPAPSAIVGATDATYTQLLALAKESLRDLQRHPWTRSTRRVTFSMLGLEDQGTLASVFGADFYSLVPGTAWNDTMKVPLFGPVGDASWQVYKQWASNPWGQYKIMNGHLYILPAPTVGHVLSAMIVSKYLVTNASGTPIEYYTADDDSPVFSDGVFLADLEWRWLKQKGEAWAVAKDVASDLISVELSRPGGLPTLSLDAGCDTALQPGVIVPAGSWTL